MGLPGAIMGMFGADMGLTGAIMGMFGADMGLSGAIMGMFGADKELSGVIMGMFSADMGLSSAIMGLSGRNNGCRALNDRRWAGNHPDRVDAAGRNRHAMPILNLATMDAPGHVHDPSPKTAFPSHRRVSIRSLVDA
jgi:hypothetical protein